MFLSSLGLLLTNSLKLSLIPKQGAKIQDEFYQNFMPKIETANVFVPEEIGVGSILSTYGYFSNEVEEPKLQPRTSLLDNLFSLNRRPTTIKSPPFVLIHGFDSSCLEFRKLAPLLADRSDVYVPDILGWGFSDVSNATSFTPVAKVEHLRSFIQQVVGQPCVLVGASLGGAVAIQLAAESPELVKSLVLIDAQVSRLNHTIHLFSVFV